MKPKTGIQQYLQSLTSKNVPAPGAIVRATSHRTIARGVVSQRTWRNGDLYSITVTSVRDNSLRHHEVLCGLDSFQELVPAPALVEPLHYVGHYGTWRPPLAGSWAAPAA